MMLLSASSQLESVANFLTVLLIFAFVIAITWFTTRYIANFQKQRMDTTNIEIIETSRISPNKYLQIVRAADKYLLIAVSKDNVTMLAELDKDTLIQKEENQNQIPVDFAGILKTVVNRNKEKYNTEKEEQADKDE